MKEAQSAVTYVIVSVILVVLMAIHLFGLYPLQTDKFSFFLVSLFVAVMLLPLLSYLKFFDIIELRRQIKILKKH